MKLSIIILSYNTKNLTFSCIRSVIDQYKKNIENREVEIIVVDNASIDGTVQKLKKLNGIKLIQNKKNFGFSKGNNIGAKIALGKYLLFLNSDTQVKDRGFFEMIKFLDDNPKIGILGAKLLNRNGESQKSAGKFYNLFILFLSLLGLERFGIVKKSPSEIKKVDWVSGASLMIRKDLFKRLKGFDERIFMYMEDVELCFRAKKLGFLTYFFPKIKLIHWEMGSSSRTFSILNIYKGTLHFYKKHARAEEYFIAKLLLITKAIVAILIGFIINNNYLKKTYFNAFKLAV